MCLHQAERGRRARGGETEAETSGEKPSSARVAVLPAMTHQLAPCSRGGRSGAGARTLPVGGCSGSWVETGVMVLSSEGEK